MTQDIKDLERDIEQTRARLDLTIDRLQDKLSMSGIVDDVLGTMRGNRYGSIYDHALDVIKRNPVPVMLVAAGVGWLIYRMGSNPPGRTARAPSLRRCRDAGDRSSSAPGLQARRPAASGRRSGFASAARRAGAPARTRPAPALKAKKPRTIRRLRDG